MEKQLFTIATFYKFAPLQQLAQFRVSLEDFCAEKSILGTILLAAEGINGTIAGTAENVAAVMSHLRNTPALDGLPAKMSQHPEMPFQRLKIKIKREIVTMGVPGINPPEQAGVYVNAREWNDLISDPEVLLIDTRNDYEVNIGTFRGATNPQTRHFTEFPNYVDHQLLHAREKKVAMFCTGGIRCEKATAYLRNKGFKNVYHLKGGILQYLQEVPASESLWEGECFVFDERVSVDHRLQRGHYALCSGCGNPVDLAATQEENHPTLCDECKRKEEHV